VNKCQQLSSHGETTNPASKLHQIPVSPQTSLSIQFSQHLLHSNFSTGFWLLILKLQEILQQLTVPLNLLLQSLYIQIKWAVQICYDKLFKSAGEISYPAALNAL
jgi:hypothetical protein